MRNFYFFALLLFGLLGSYAQQNVILSGYVTDIETNETLIGVNIILPKLNLGTTTNEYGFYSINLPQGQQQLLISFLGFENYLKEFTLTQDLTLNVKLNPEAELLDEVIVSDNVEPVSYTHLTLPTN